MKKIIRDVDEERGIVQVTTSDERWYLKPANNKESGLPEYLPVPSVTFIAHSYPKGIAYMKWLSDKGWDEAEAIKNAAGNKGSKVHQACDAILNGHEVRIDSTFMNHETEKEEELTLEECDAIISFVKWMKDLEKAGKVLTSVANEQVLFSEEHGYAGTFDYICKIDSEYWLIDFKTSQHIWPEHQLQVSAYKEAIENGENPIEGLPADETLRLAVLQLGYRLNKNGYKWNEIEPNFDLFLATKQIWQNEHGKEKPSQKDYPLVISPGKDISVEEVLEDLGVRNDG